jgi:hypothetical protein
MRRLAITLLTAGLLAGLAAVTAVRPTRAAPADLVLNELQADNETTLADPAGQFDDWVELYNRGQAPIDLGDYYLSDDPADPQQFPLPDLELAPGAYALIWCDNDADQGADHANFSLNKDGETLVLSTAAEIVDQVTFGLQQVDWSHARQQGGATPWTDCARPSPRAANACGDAPTPTATATPTLPSPTPSRTPSPTPTLPSPTPSPTPAVTVGPLEVHLYLPWAGRTR